MLAAARLKDEPQGPELEPCAIHQIMAMTGSAKVLA